jgi:hypothetical protein
METKKSILAIAVISTTLFASSCSKESMNEINPQSSPTVANSSAMSINGRQGTMDAYYDSALFTINFKQFSDKAAQTLVAQNSSINVIYLMDNPLPNGQMFISVIDAIQGDGFNPVWQEQQVVFNPGFTPHQFFSDTQVLNAASGINPEIKLVANGDVYRCSVIGPKK